MTDPSDEDVSIPNRTLNTVQERALQAEKEKLYMDIPRGVINEIEQIIREEVD